ncbi:MAG: hypothetical protein Q8P41_02735 [Pseudomonadota bacterium]|nr:hypothetical protein [Pseudomonadota bacterium]
MGLRLTLLYTFAANYSFDGFQRWAGRDHLLVQAWLPVTQSVIAAVAALGGSITDARIAMSVLAAGAVAAGVVVAGRLGGRVAAWAFLVPSCYGPFLVWGGALYQEGTFLLVLFSGLALALSGRLALADLVIGLLGLVRYEGWPCVVLYAAWRRDPRALVALWGMGAWLLIRYGLDLGGYHASPADFDDWEGLGDRTTVSSWARDARRLFMSAWNSGGVSFGVAAVVGIVTGWRRPGVLLLAAVGLAQVAAVAGWLAGLEIATYRMLVVPVVVAGVLGAAGASAVWARLSESLRPGLVLIGTLLLCVGVVDAWRATRSEVFKLTPERVLLARIAARPDCDWVVTPRAGLGTRLRHDGCEVLQGLGAPRHGEGFWCDTWAVAPPPERACTARAVWDGESYEVAFHGNMGPGAAGMSEDAVPTGAPAP